MSYYGYEDQEFYSPVLAYEETIMKLEEEIKSSVKDEIINELNKLRTENEMLQDVKARMNELEREHRNKVRELETAKNEAINIVRREKLSQLLSDFQLIVYTTGYDYIYAEKCNECDDKRRRSFISPLGKEMSEECTCNKQMKKYKVTEEHVTEFKSRDNKLHIWFKPYRDSEDGYTISQYFEGYSDDLPYEEVATYRPFFRDKDKCQAYCDWLNEKEEGKLHDTIPQAPKSRS